MRAWLRLPIVSLILILGNILARAEQDPLQVFDGVWATTTPPFLHFIFNQISGNAREVSLPFGQAIITQSDGRSGSNFKLSSSNIVGDCFYLILFDQFKMHWELKEGPAQCPSSARFDKFSTRSSPPPLPADPCTGADVHWKSTESIGTKAAFEDHLKRYSTCNYAGLARAKIAALNNPGPSPNTTTAPSPMPVPSPETLPRRSTWTHNRSIMSVLLDRGNLKIYYEEPRAGMMNEGVRSGTLLFDGRASNDQVSGTAYVFDQRCGKFPYQVSGELSNGARRLFMTGRAPTSLSESCQVINYRDDSLLFVRKD